MAGASLGRSKEEVLSTCVLVLMNQNHSRLYATQPFGLGNRPIIWMPPIDETDRPSRMAMLPLATALLLIVAGTFGTVLLVSAAAWLCLSRG